MITVWGPYLQNFDSSSGQYFLYKEPHPEPIRNSGTPFLKESVSILLGELLKPLRVPSTALPKLGPDSVESDDAVIRAAISMMDSDVLQKVRATNDDREALAVLALGEDFRFGDLSDCEPLRDKVLQYIRSSDASHSKQPKERLRPGRPASRERVEIRQYITVHMETTYQRLLFEKRTGLRRKKRTEAAKKICMSLYGNDNLKVHPMIRIVLREDYPYKRRARAD